MISDTERREVARRLRENAEAHPKMSLILNLAFADDSLKPDGAMEWKVTPHDAAMRLADLIEPPYPDATASYKGWRVQVYDPDGVLVSPSNAAADLVRAHADGKRPSEPKVRCVAEVKVDGERLEEPVHDAAVELTGIDRDALLELADGLDKDADDIIGAARNAQFTGGGPRMEEAKHDAYDWRQIARSIREALGVADG